MSWAGSGATRQTEDGFDGWDEDCTVAHQVIQARAASDDATFRAGVKAQLGLSDCAGSSTPEGLADVT